MQEVLLFLAKLFLALCALRELGNRFGPFASALVPLDEVIEDVDAGSFTGEDFLALAAECRCPALLHMVLVAEHRSKLEVIDYMKFHGYVIKIMPYCNLLSYSPSQSRNHSHRTAWSWYQHHWEILLSEICVVFPGEPFLVGSHSPNLAVGPPKP